MARVPVASNQVRAARNNPVALRSVDSSGLVQGLDNLASGFAQMEARQQRAAAKGVDTEYANYVRKTFYDPDNGYMFDKGGNAMGRGKAVLADLEAEKKRLLEGVTGPARVKAQEALDSRHNSAAQRAAIHLNSESTTFLTEQGNARVQSAIEDAAVDPTRTAAALETIEVEVAEMAEINGWSKEQTEEKLEDKRTAVFKGITERLAMHDPIAALAYLQDRKGRMDPGVVTKMESVLIPAAKEYDGRQRGQAAFDGVKGKFNGFADLEGRYGLPNGYLDRTAYIESRHNPNAKNPNSSAGGLFQFIDSTANAYGLTNRYDPAAASDAAARLARDNAATLRKTLGREPTAAELYLAHQQGGGGASRLLANPSALASSIVGLDAVRLNGGKADMTAGQFAALWINKFNGGKNQSYTGSVVGTSTPTANTDAYMQQLLAIEDPTVRDAAIDEFNLRSKVAENEAAAAAAEARDRAFQMIEAGGGIDGLSLDERQALGEKSMSELRTYANKVASGEEPDTDDAFKVGLFEQMGDDPKGFASADPLEWRNSLDDADFNYFLKQQLQMRQGDGGSAPAPDYSRVNTQATAMLDAYGYDKGPAQQGLISDLLQWESEFIGENKVIPTDLELREELSKRVAAMGEAPSTASVKAISPSQASTAAKLHLDRAGLKKDVEAQQFVQADLMEWSEQISRETGELPNSVMVDRKARQLTSKVEFDPSILPFNALEFHAFEAMRDPDIAEIDPLELMNKGFTVDGVEIGQSAILTASGEFYAAAGRRATTPELITYFTEKMAGL